MKTKLEQRDVVQKLSSLQQITESIESDLQRVCQTQTEIEIDLKQICTMEGPATVHQIGNNYFYQKRKRQMLSAIIQERQKLEQLHRQHLESLNSMKRSLAHSIRRLGHLTSKPS